MCIRDRFRKSAGKIIIEFLKPMEKGLKKTEFVSELKSIVEAATRKLEDEARENWGDDTFFSSTTP